MNTHNIYDDFIEMIIWFDIAILETLIDSDSPPLAPTARPRPPSSHSMASACVTRAGSGLTNGD